MTTRHLARMIATCLVAVTANACGSASASKKDVIARGNAICASAVRSLRAVAAPGNGSPAALTDYVKRVEPIIAQEVTQLRRLPRPAADKAVLDRYIDAEATAGSVYEQLVAAAQRNNTSAVAADLAALRVNPAQSLARRYGMSECAAAAGTAIR